MRQLNGGIDDYTLKSNGAAFHGLVIIVSGSLPAVAGVGYR